MELQNSYNRISRESYNFEKKIKKVFFWKIYKNYTQNARNFGNDVRRIKSTAEEIQGKGLEFEIKGKHY